MESQSTNFVLDVTNDTFQEMVLDESKKRPVVVDFWAPWCGPCKALGPILEKLAEQDQGRWLLAKINTDEHGSLSEQFGVRGIPAVKAVVDGQLVDEFVGLKPEIQVKRWLAGFVPTAADIHVSSAEKALQEGHLEDAKQQFTQALEIQSSHPKALFGLSKYFQQTGDLEQAKAMLEKIPTYEREAFAQDYAKLKLELEGQNTGDIDKLRNELLANPENLAPRIALAQALLAEERFEEALEQYIETVRLDRGEFREKARVSMLEVFNALGSTDERTKKYRTLLGQALFS